MSALTTRNPARNRGFSLIEVMVAMVLGMLLSIGIISLFTNSNSLNRTQEALARLQENGRYAMTVLIDDMRSSLSLPIISEVNSHAAVPTANGVLAPAMAPMVYVANLQTLLPRWTGGNVMPTGWPANTPYPMSPRWLLQGHECAVGSATCTPTPPTTLPAIGTAAGNRVRGADVLTTRVLSSQGWTLIGGAGGSIRNCNASSGTLDSVTVGSLASEPATNFQNNDLAMVWTRTGGQIFQVTVSGAAGGIQILTPVNLIGGINVPCSVVNTGGEDIPVLYNFSRDLRTITYFVQLVADPNPDATAGRTIPTLMRWTEGAPLNTRTADVVASGVERLDFIYGVEDRAGTVRYLSASDLEAASNAATCMKPPKQYEALPANTMEPACLWRSVRSIEAHVLMNTINNVYTLSAADMAYRYSVNGGATVAYTTPAAPTATLPNGLPAGNMMRREFSVQVALRNSLP